MSILQNKIDFEAIVEVRNANANGDPLNGNMPRTTIGWIISKALRGKTRRKKTTINQANEMVK